MHILEEIKNDGTYVRIGVTNRKADKRIIESCKESGDFVDVELYIFNVEENQQIKIEKSIFRVK